MSTSTPDGRVPGSAGADGAADLLLGNATLVLPATTLRGWVRVQDGRIVEIGAGAALPPGAKDCHGDYVAPGLIELHTDNLERHIEPRPGVDWPHAAAILAHDAELASTGITTVFDAMRVGSIPGGRARHIAYARALSRELLALRAAGLLKIGHFLHLRAEICSETLVQELAEFDESDRVGLLSLMDHTPGQRQFRDLATLENYVRKRRGLSDAEFIEHVATLKELRVRIGDAHERAAVGEAARLGAVLASHDDTTAAQVAVSASHGVRLAEFPTTTEAARACRANGIAVMMGAPNLIRGGSHSGNVAAAALAEAGLLDILSSDYVPSALLLAAVRLGRRWNDMARGMACVTATPASAVGLDDRGRLQVGFRGDLLRFGLVDAVPILRGVWVGGRQVA